MVSCDRSVELIDQFQNKKILVIGDVMLDHYVFGSVERVNPEAAVPLLDIETETHATGGAGNVAKNAAKLGATVTLLSIVGDDQTAEHLKQAVTSEGYILRSLTDSARPTPRKTRFVASNQPLLRADHEKKQDLSSGIEAQLLGDISEQAAHHDAILVSDYAKGVITKNVAEAIMAAAVKYTIPIAIDAKPTHLSWFRGASFMSPNLKEAREALEVSENVSMEPVELAERFAVQFKTTACITLSEQGVVVVGPDQPSLQVQQTHVREVFDVSGAGDTAIVTILLSRLCGATWAEALQLANAAAAVVIAKVGTVGVSTDELRLMMCHEHE